MAVSVVTSATDTRSSSVHGVKPEFRAVVRDEAGVRGAAQVRLRRAVRDLSDCARRTGRGQERVGLDGSQSMR
jgi:hypothetical protein